MTAKKTSAALLAGTYKLPSEQKPQDLPKPRSKPSRYSISVSGVMYERMRAQVSGGPLAAFVDDIVTSALDDRATAARIVAKCRRDSP